jgi:hypothetical protein
MATASASAKRARCTGRFRLAILPIGAYEPRWFMRDQHMNPEEAVTAFLDSGAELALAHHHGTFQLTDEGIDAPAQALGVALTQRGLTADRFRTLRPGRCGSCPSRKTASREWRSGTATGKAIVESDLHQIDLLILVEDERQACR